MVTDDLSQSCFDLRKMMDIYLKDFTRDKKRTNYVSFYIPVSSGFEYGDNFDKSKSDIFHQEVAKIIGQAYPNDFRPFNGNICEYIKSKHFYCRLHPIEFSGWGLKEDIVNTFFPVCQELENVKANIGLCRYGDTVYNVTCEEMCFMFIMFLKNIKNIIEQCRENNIQLFDIGKYFKFQYIEKFKKGFSTDDTAYQMLLLISQQIHA